MFREDTTTGKGLGAVEGLLDGKKDVMIGIVNDKLTFTPLKDAISKTKKLNPDLLRAMKILSI